MRGAPLKVINAIASKSAKDYDDDETKSIDKEIWFMYNQIGVSRPTYQRQGRNQHWKKKDCKWKDCEWKKHE